VLCGAGTLPRVDALDLAAIYHRPEVLNHIFHRLCLGIQLLCGSSALLGVGGTALGHLLHLRNRAANLFDPARLKQADLTRLSKQIDITVTGEGLKIDLIEDKGGTFFESGSPRLSENGVTLLNLLSAQLKTLPNRLLIEGHTDAQPYSSDTGYTNWELSSDRANSARRLLQQGGIGANQISQVRGYADQMLRVPSNPLDPSNRRVSLIVQWADAAQPSSDPLQLPPASNAPANPIQATAAVSPTKSAGTGASPTPD
jgi:outer membrane protein OmpA-like peptidoglycan-associated protein